MQKLLIFLIAIIFTASSSFSQMGKTRVVAIDELVTLALPASFKKLFNDGVNRTNPKGNGIFVNENELIKITYDLSAVYDPGGVDVGDNDVHEWADKQLTALKQDARFEYVDDGNFLQEGKNIGYIKFIINEPAGPDSFHLLFFTSIKDKLAQFKFSCPAKLQKKWESAAETIANSLRLQENAPPRNLM